MFDLTFALLGIGAILGGTLLWQFKGSIKDIIEYFKKNRSILWGIVLFTGAFIGLAVTSLVLALLLTPSAKADGFKDLTYLNYAEVYIGMDYTNKLSPQCHKGQYSDRLTSNGGFRLNLIQTESRRVEVNTTYIHHSCAYNRDREQYDAVGLQMTWKLFSR